MERWNAEYDMFLIPLANAFRTTFKKELKMLTDLVERLTIPCVVVGVGLAPQPEIQQVDVSSR